MSDTSAAGTISLCAVFTGLTTAAVALRFYARKHQKNPLLADDWLMIPGLLTFIAASAILIYSVTPLKFLGYSSFDFTPEEVAVHAQLSMTLNIVHNIITVVCLGCIKASILFFYKRIFCVSGRKAALNIVVVCSIIVIGCWVVTYCFLVGFQCHTHFSALWDGTYVKYCTYSFPVLLSEAITDFLLDVWVLVVPIPAIMKLHTSTSRKFALVGIFSLACLGVAAGIARMVVYIELMSAGPEGFIEIDQERESKHHFKGEVVVNVFTGALTKSTFYMMMEIGVALVAVNLPSIWLLFAAMSPAVIARRFRNVFSVASFRRRKSEKLGIQDKVDAPRSTSTTGSDVPIPGPVAERSVEVREVDQDADPDEMGASHGQIHVSHSVKLTLEEDGEDEEDGEYGENGKYGKV
ncbi:hypothetical protein NOR_01129 [Metarhizium rileyi]|uniref:Rhodopsin domain-containing protein n=1 Tax=Metarhizium rileyi (strain RCEF 4871) TaxID=1649241 RepID=A0A167JSA0_METRR|nr:hypothetical protein NOR_01129 [Metarhizium rileyi RCEF 4871]